MRAAELGGVIANSHKVRGMKKGNASLTESLWLVLHAKLLNDVRKLEDALRPASNQGLIEIHARLTAARRDVSEHFDYEERYGYMDGVGAREPRLEGAIQKLVCEHGQLRHSLDAIIANAAAATRDKRKIRRDVRQWIRRLREHEARETELVEATFNLDFRAGGQTR